MTGPQIARSMMFGFVPVAALNLVMAIGNDNDSLIYIYSVSLFVSCIVLAIAQWRISK